MKTWQQLKSHPQLFNRFFLREKVLRAIREYFYQQQVHETEVPILAPALPAESYLEVFETTLLTRLRKKYPAYLTTSPEMFLKKLLVAGVGNCYTLTRSFRNTEYMSQSHNSEFTILEWYRVDADYKHLMKDVEELFVFIHKEIQQNSNIIPAEAGIHSNRSRIKPEMTLLYQNQAIDLSPPWERISMVEAFAKFARVDLLKILDEGGMRNIAMAKGYSIHNATWEELFNQIFLNEVAAKFPQDRPIIIYDYPIQLAALAAKPKNSDPRFAQRFEIYIGDIELADGCTELTDIKEQEKRFAKEKKKIRKQGNKLPTVDHEFIEALKLGLPNCAGIALGVDRLIMLLADVPQIQDTLYFPASQLWEDID